MNMTTKVAEKLKINTRAFIVEAVRDILSDPDFGLKLTRKAGKRFKQAQTKKGKTFSLAEMRKKYC